MTTKHYFHHKALVLSRHGLHLFWRQRFLARKDARGRIAEQGPSRKCVTLDILVFFHHFLCFDVAKLRIVAETAKHLG